MSCACGHHHHPAPVMPDAGTPVTLDPAPVVITGQLICADAAQMLLALTHLPAHAEASRAEPGCLRFDLAQDADPLVWTLAEVFADREALAAHGAALAQRAWGQASGAIRRDYVTAEAQPRLRPETPRDAPAIAALLDRAFGGRDESGLVAGLRADGDLALSLVADAGGAIVGHVALSPFAAPAPALALAPVAVHPALQGRGLGGALVRAALAAFADHSIVVLGDPGYYGRFGFAAADLDSPYAGPHLMSAGPALPAGARVSHARAFAGLQDAD